ncbi:hypothetical protein HJC23_009067 [Cyclotella cryptica]|uniref:Uncharacterized protein n=1 Tax=Cyclotella cryptica TaxID=29204 RepID=A0ABD3QY56_9STRA
MEIDSKRRSDGTIKSCSGGGCRGSQQYRSSLDEQLALATSTLTVGPSTVTKLDIDNTSFVMPPLHKLHPNLYNNSMRDVFMDDSRNESNTQSAQGVPGFPDFPSFWTGEPSLQQRCQHDKRKKQGTACKKSPKRRRLVRKAVNTPYGSIPSTSSFTSSPNVVATTKAIKRKARADRKFIRLEKCLKLKEKRNRKKNMGELCRGIASMCK